MKYYLGSTLAAQRMESMLDTTPIVRRKISTLLSQYTSQLLKITAAKDPSIVRLCMELLRDFTLKRVELKKNIPNDIKSYTKNLIITRHRVFRKTFDELVPLMQEQDAKNKKDAG